MTLRLISLLCALLASPAGAADRFVVLASTTSTEQSGLFGHILPMFELDTGIAVRVVAVGTGQALKIGMQGDADALLVHDRVGEDRFIADGHGADRRDVMYNDFVLIGPAADPAKVAGLTDAALALRRIADAKAPFASRGDDSGTHRSELRLWKAAGVDPKAAEGGWYRELGSGMGPTLNTAAGLGAYALADRATWASFRNRQSLALLVQGDKAMTNPYGGILVARARNPDDARLWHDWLTGPRGKAAIAGFRIDGEQVFFP
ncbi:MAG: substrate-binding domain-containing protein [Alphaproteobacteria bacterium]|nr:substrate-binding domain-containing protein [Alphaproteobacteria bacterium]